MQSRIAIGYGLDAVVERSAWKKILVFKEADLNSGIPLSDESVDVATSLALLEHLREPALFVKEVFRILKPNGTCIF